MVNEKLSPTEATLRERARNIRLVLADCDGVLTDTGVYYSHTGEEMKRFSIRDGMGVELLRQRGIEMAILTREQTEIVHTRSEKLKLPYLFMGVWDKAEAIPEILKKTGKSIEQLAFIGDDVNDLGAIEAIGKFGLTGCPGDGLRIVRDQVHYTTIAKGGYGAFREFADWIISFLD